MTSQANDLPRFLRALYYGYPLDTTGYGTACRGYLHSLSEADIQYAVRSFSPKGLLLPDPVIEEAINRPITPDFHLCHMSPTWIVKYKLTPPLERTVVITALETEEVPSGWLPLLEKVREVWFPCQHNVKVFKRSCKTPAFIIPHAILPYRTPNDTLNIDALLGLRKTDFVFMGIFAWQERKNPLGIIEAFMKAFPKEDTAVLVLKVMYGMVEEAVALRQIADLLSRIGSNVREAFRRVKIVSGVWPEGIMRALLSRCDCYVSLHRGEAWCYPLFEAACAGIPVIATNYGGPVDYLTGESHCLVDYQLTAISTPYMEFNKEMTWACPDQHMAMQYMKLVFEDRARQKSLARSHARLMSERYSTAMIGSLISARLMDMVKG